MKSTSSCEAPFTHSHRIPLGQGARRFARRYRVAYGFRRPLRRQAGGRKGSAASRDLFDVMLLLRTKASLRESGGILYLATIARFTKFCSRPSTTLHKRTARFSGYDFRSSHARRIAEAQRADDDRVSVLTERGRAEVPRLAGTERTGLQPSSTFHIRPNFLTFAGSCKISEVGEE